MVIFVFFEACFVFIFFFYFTPHDPSSSSSFFVPCTALENRLAKTTTPITENLTTPQSKIESKHGGKSPRWYVYHTVISDPFAKYGVVIMIFLAEIAKSVHLCNKILDSVGF